MAKAARKSKTKRIPKSLQLTPAERAHSQRIGSAGSLEDALELGRRTAAKLKAQRLFREASGDAAAPGLTVGAHAPERYDFRDSGDGSNLCGILNLVQS